LTIYKQYNNSNNCIIIIIVLGARNKPVTPNHLQRLTPKIVGSTKVTVSIIIIRSVKEWKIFLFFILSLKNYRYHFLNYLPTTSLMKSS